MEKENLIRIGPFPPSNEQHVFFCCRMCSLTLECVLLL